MFVSKTKFMFLVKRNLCLSFKTEFLAISQSGVPSVHWFDHPISHLVMLRQNQFVKENVEVSFLLHHKVQIENSPKLKRGLV